MKVIACYALLVAAVHAQPSPNSNDAVAAQAAADAPSPIALAMSGGGFIVLGSFRRRVRE